MLQIAFSEQPRKYYVHSGSQAWVNTDQVSANFHCCGTWLFITWPEVLDFPPNCSFRNSCPLVVGILATTKRSWISDFEIAGKQSFLLRSWFLQKLSVSFKIKQRDHNLFGFFFVCFRGNSVLNLFTEFLTMATGSNADISLSKHWHSLSLVLHAACLKDLWNEPLKRLPRYSCVVIWC